MNFIDFLWDVLKILTLILAILLTATMIIVFAGGIADRLIDRPANVERGMK